MDGEERGWLRQIERLTRVQLEPVPLPADFAAAVASMPMPKQAPPTANRRHDEARRTNDNPNANNARRRQFGKRKPDGVGTHKGAIRKTGGR